MPKFTMGVNDIPQLEKMRSSYVACKDFSLYFSLYLSLSSDQVPESHI